MDRNPWKLATFGIALVGTTALSTGLTTAWMLRPAAEAQAQAAPAPPAPAPALRPATRAVAAPAPSTPRAYPAVARAETPAAVTRVASTTAADCSTGGERAMRIAKPGAIGALLGAGLGAGGGAIADRGQGAGEGALIGGLAGAALGAGYGADQTENEGGTNLRGGKGLDAAPAAPAPRADTVQTFSPATGGDRLQVYGVR